MQRARKDKVFLLLQRKAEFFADTGGNVCDLLVMIHQCRAYKIDRVRKARDKVEQGNLRFFDHGVLRKSPASAS